MRHALTVGLFTMLSMLLIACGTPQSEPGTNVRAQLLQQDSTSISIPSEPFSDSNNTTPQPGQPKQQPTPSQSTRSKQQPKEPQSESIENQSTTSRSVESEQQLTPSTQETVLPALPSEQSSRIGTDTEWLCSENSPSPIVDDLTTNVTEILRCVVVIEYTDNTIIVQSNGIPNHDFNSGIGCCATEQRYRWLIPRYPKMAQTATAAPDRGPIAITVTGIPIYGPEEGPGGDAVALHHEYFVEDRQPIELGICGGHSGPGGTYHYHFDGNCIHWHPENDGESWTDWTPDKIDQTKHSRILGYAFDGFPIYGPYGWDEDGSVIMLTSSYKLKETANGYNGISDWEYVDKLGDLDECNGVYGPTPEYTAGIYHYHSTFKNGTNLIGFPYFLLCYKGTPIIENFRSGQEEDRRQGDGDRPPRQGDGDR